VHEQQEAAMDVIKLERSDLVRIENARDMRVRVENGTVWITQERDTRDVMLEDGESLRLDCDGLALISAFGLALISISRS
jgi:Protein of unknown function (DUF2917)